MKLNLTNPQLLTEPLFFLVLKTELYMYVAYVGIYKLLAIKFMSHKFVKKRSRGATYPIHPF